MKGSEVLIHGENGGTLGMVPLIINPIYTLYTVVGIYDYIMLHQVKKLGVPTHDLV